MDLDQLHEENDLLNQRIYEIDSHIFNDNFSHKNDLFEEVDRPG